jgi:hypothetical protein
MLNVNDLKRTMETMPENNTIIVHFIHPTLIQRDKTIRIKRTFSEYYFEKVIFDSQKIITSAVNFTKKDFKLLLEDYCITTDATEASLLKEKRREDLFKNNTEELIKEIFG